VDKGSHSNCSHDALEHRQAKDTRESSPADDKQYWEPKRNVREHDFIFACLNLDRSEYKVTAEQFRGLSVDGGAPAVSPTVGDQQPPGGRTEHVNVEMVGTVAQ
jgi:hypothetical protein